jgi:hypothetical protein
MTYELTYRNFHSTIVYMHAVHTLRRKYQNRQVDSLVWVVLLKTVAEDSVGQGMAGAIP